MALEAGRAFVDILPRLAKGFASSLDKQVQPVLKRVGKRASALGKSLSRNVTLPLLGLGAVAGRELQRVNEGLREVVTLTGRTGEAADKTFEQFSDSLKVLSRETGIAQSVLVDGLYQALSAGVDVENPFDFLAVASQTAVAGVTDVETAVDGLTTIINAFGLSSVDAMAVADSMFTAVKGGKTTFEELSGALFQVAPTASSLGIEFQDVNAALAALTSQGVPTREATTRLREAMNSLLRQGEKLNPIFAELGQESTEAAIQELGLQGALDAVFEAADGSQTKLIELLGSTEAVQAVSILAGTGSEKFAAELRNQADAAGATRAAFEEIDKARSFERFLNTIKNLGMTIAEAFLPAVQRIVEFLTPLIEKFGDLDPTIQTVIVGILAAAAAAGPLLAIFGAIATVLGALSLPVLAVIAVVAAAVAVFFLFRDEIMAAVQAVLDFFTDDVAPIFEDFIAFWAENWGKALQAVTNILGIIAAVIRGVVGRIVAIWNRWGDDILLVVRTVWDLLREVIRNALQIIKGIVQVFIGIFTLDWSTFWAGISSIVDGVWDAIVAIVKAAGGLLRAAVAAIWDGIKLVFETAINIVKGIFQRFWPALLIIATGGLGAIVLLIVKNWDTIKRITGELIGAVAGFFRRLPGRIASAVAGEFQKMVDLGGTIIGWLKDGLEESIGNALDFWKNLPGRIWDAVSEVKDRLVNLGIEIVKRVIDGITQGPSIVDALVRKVPGLGSGLPLKDAPGIGRIIPGAHGLVATKPTLALIGEDPSTTPEVLAPRRMLQETFAEVAGRLLGEIAAMVPEDDGPIGPSVGSLMRDFVVNEPGASPEEIMQAANQRLARRLRVPGG